MTTISICPVCGGNEFSAFRSCTDYTVSRETFELVTCTTCGLTITNPQPDPENIGYYYQSENYISHSGKGTSLVGKSYLAVRRYTLGWKLNLINKLNPAATKKLLDYGCGTGEFISTCKQNGWQVTGVEPSDDVRTKAEALSNSPVLPNLSLVKDNDFTTITLWHVLEHVPDLNALLTQLRSILSENGTIFIAIPNHNSWEAQHYEQYWAGYDVPRHLWHFTQDTMKALLEKNELKLNRIIPMKLDAFYISMLSEKYKHNTNTILGIMKAFANGLKSNLLAKRNMEYSSLIYVVKK